MTKTKLEIIEETVAAYENVGNRASVGTVETGRRCLYLAPNGNKCAVGRCMIDGSVIDAENGMRGALDAVSPGVERIFNLEEILKPEYRGHDKSFWRGLQRLHDLNSNWNMESSGLSEIGKQALSELKLRYS